MPIRLLSPASPIAHAPSAGRARRGALVALLLTLLPSAVPTQAPAPALGARACPRFARVPGYGACTNVGGRTCGFCTYRCNDDTVVRWNVCAL